MPPPAPAATCNLVACSKAPTHNAPTHRSRTPSPLPTITCRPLQQSDPAVCHCESHKTVHIVAEAWTGAVWMREQRAGRCETYTCSSDTATYACMSQNICLPRLHCRYCRVVISPRHGCRAVTHLFYKCSSPCMPQGACHYHPAGRYFGDSGYTARGRGAYLDS